jgi:hypothetical protein
MDSGNGFAMMLGTIVENGAGSGMAGCAYCFLTVDFVYHSIVTVD